MELCVLWAVFIAQALYMLLPVEANNNHEIRILNNEYYYNHSDIVKALKTSPRSWIIGRSRTVTKLLSSGEECVFLQLDSLTEEEVNLTETYDYNKQKNIRGWNGTFHSLSGWSNQNPEVNRKLPNNVVLRATGDSWTLNLTLIYSWYGKWSLLRVEGTEQDYAINKDCLLVVSDPPRSTDVPKEAQNLYRRLCGQVEDFKKMYKKTCVAPPAPTTTTTTTTSTTTTSSSTTTTTTTTTTEASETPQKEDGQVSVESTATTVLTTFGC